MTIHDICDGLKEAKQSNKTFALSGAGTVPYSIPAEVEDPLFLEDNVLKIHDILHNRGTDNNGSGRNNFSSEGELVAQLQVNAFLSSYQRTGTLSGRRRLDRLASKYTRTIVNSGKKGPLSGQLRDIGAKVDPDFTSFIITGNTV